VLTVKFMVCVYVSAKKPVDPLVTRELTQTLTVTAMAKKVPQNKTFIHVQ